MVNSGLKSFTIDVLRATIFAVLMSVILTGILAILTKYVNIDGNVVKIINIACRILSILVGCILGIGYCEKGIIKGVTVSLMFILITYIIYGIIKGNFAISKIMLVDAIADIIFGMISAVISVNVKVKR